MAGKQRWEPAKTEGKRKHEEDHFLKRWKQAHFPKYVFSVHLSTHFYQILKNTVLSQLI